MIRLYDYYGPEILGFDIDKNKKTDDSAKGQVVVLGEMSGEMSVTFTNHLNTEMALHEPIYVLAHAPSNDGVAQQVRDVRNSFILDQLKSKLQYERDIAMGRIQVRYTLNISRNVSHPRCYRDAT